MRARLGELGEVSERSDDAHALLGDAPAEPLVGAFQVAAVSRQARDVGVVRDEKAGAGDAPHQPEVLEPSIGAQNGEMIDRPELAGLPQRGQAPPRQEGPGGDLVEAMFDDPLGFRGPLDGSHLIC